MEENKKRVLSGVMRSRKGTGKEKVWGTAWSTGDRGRRRSEGGGGRATDEGRRVRDF